MWPHSCNCVMKIACVDTEQKGNSPLERIRISDEHQPKIAKTTRSFQWDGKQELQALKGAKDYNLRFYDETNNNK